MSIPEEVKTKILAEFKAGLDRHLFSEKGYPQQVKIVTTYEKCEQTLTIKFENKK